MMIFFLTKPTKKGNKTCLYMIIRTQDGLCMYEKFLSKLIPENTCDDSLFLLKIGDSIDGYDEKTD
jgi:hypothetical protein